MTQNIPTFTKSRQVPGRPLQPGPGVNPNLQAGAPVPISTPQEPSYILNVPTANGNMQVPVTGDRPSTSPAPRMEETPRDKEGSVLSSEYERVDPPSNFVPYSWNQLNVRKFDPFDQAKLARGINTRTFSLVLDVLAATCDQDVRDFCVADFQFLCYWHRQNSYLATPQNLTYISRYGHKIEKQQSVTKVKVNFLGPTKADYAKLQEQGLALPTVRDLELIITTKMDDDKAWLFDNAQFIDAVPLADEIAALRKAGVKLPEVEARINKFAELSKTMPGLGILPLINEIQKTYTCGVDESARVKDPKVAEWSKDDWLRWADRLENEDLDLPNDQLEEAAQIRTILSTDKLPLAREQELPLAFSLWTHFPWI